MWCVGDLCIDLYYLLKHEFWVNTFLDFLEYTNKICILDLISNFDIFSSQDEQKSQNFGWVAL